ncbi:hypothetical protein DER44DRAFT_510352 [Fusarium oxysporum]|nr:hypothetical protein DER44DRAFT_510352 [Fusarium oxysporum]
MIRECRFNIPTSVPRCGPLSKSAFKPPMSTLSRARRVFFAMHATHQLIRFEIASLGLCAFYFLGPLSVTWKVKQPLYTLIGSGSWNVISMFALQLRKQQHMDQSRHVEKCLNTHGIASHQMHLTELK